MVTPSCVYLSIYHVPIPALNMGESQVVGPLKPSAFPLLTQHVQLFCSCATTQRVIPPHGCINAVHLPLVADLRQSAAYIRCLSAVWLTPFLSDIIS